MGTLAAAAGGRGWPRPSPTSCSTRFRPSRAVSSNSPAGAVTLLITFLSLVFGELAPKRLALQQSERLATLVSYPMYVLSVVARPIVWLLSGATQAVLLLVGSRHSPTPGVSMQDIRYLIEAGASQGLLESSERRWALEALELGERRVRDVMRPRIDMEALDIDTPSDEVVGALAMSGFSRLPVYEGSPDRILGFVYMKDVFLQQHLKQPLQLRKLLRPVLYVPETLPLDRLLARFQEKKTQFAVVLDEYGGTEGLVTIEDLLRNIVGDIHDEYRKDDEEMIAVHSPGAWLIDGALGLYELTALLRKSRPQFEPPRDVSTVSGLIQNELQRMPQVGDALEFDGVRFEVTTMDGQRIDRVLVQVAPGPDR